MGILRLQEPQSLTKIKCNQNTVYKDGITPFKAGIHVVSGSVLWLVVQYQEKLDCLKAGRMAKINGNYTASETAKSNQNPLSKLLKLVYKA